MNDIGNSFIVIMAFFFFFWFHCGTFITFLMSLLMACNQATRPVQNELVEGD